MLVLTKNTRKEKKATNFPCHMAVLSVQPAAEPVFNINSQRISQPVTGAAQPQLDKCPLGHSAKGIGWQSWDN